MQNHIKSMIYASAALVALLGWSWHRADLPAADKPAKIHILYTSDAVGYYEPCG